MTRSCGLYRNQLDAFKTWLGPRALPPVGAWEKVRWRGKPGQPVRIVFDNLKSPQYLTANAAAAPDVKKFIASLQARRQHVAGTERRAVAPAQPAYFSDYERASDLRGAVKMVAEYLQDPDNAQNWAQDFQDWCTEQLGHHAAWLKSIETPTKES